MTVAELYLGEYSKGQWTTKGKKDARSFFEERGRGKDVYYRVDDDQVVAAQTFDECANALENGDDLYRMATDPWKIRCTWKGSSRDGKECFVRVDVAVRPKFDERAFWRVWEPAILATRAIGGRLEEAAVAARVVEASKLLIQQNLSATEYKNLPELEGAVFWKLNIFERTLGSLGLAYVASTPARFVAPSVEKENELKRREEERKEALQREKEVCDYEAEKARIVAEKRKIEIATELSELDRRFQTMELNAKAVELKKEHEIKMFELEKTREIKNAKAVELKREHEVKMFELEKTREIKDAKADELKKEHEIKMFKLEKAREIENAKADELKREHEVKMFELEKAREIKDAKAVELKKEHEVKMFELEKAREIKDAKAVELKKEHEIKMFELDKVREIKNAKAVELKRNHEIKMFELEKEHEIKMLELEKEHELKTLKLEHDLEAERRRPDEERAERERSDARIAELDKFIKSAVEGVMALQAETAKIFKDWKDGYLKTLSPPAFNAYLNNISQDAVEAMGLARDPRFYSRRFNAVERKFQVEIDQIVRTRDPRSRLNTTHIRCNQEIKVRFRAPIDGYVTVLNLGASGSFWRVVPNCDGLTYDGRDEFRVAGVEPREAYVSQGKDYSIPGDNLYRGFLFEGRPEDKKDKSLHNLWEEYIVVVTKNKPLFDDYERVNKDDFDNPFVELSQERLDRVIDQLTELKPDEFAVGTCGFTLIDDEY